MKQKFCPKCHQLLRVDGKHALKCNPKKPFKVDFQPHITMKTINIPAKERLKRGNGKTVKISAEDCKWIEEERENGMFKSMKKIRRGYLPAIVQYCIHFLKACKEQQDELEQ